LLNHLGTAARIGLALLMFMGALNMVAYYVRPTLFPPFHPFMQTLVDSGYLLVPKLLELLGACLLLTRFRALGLTLLWPVIVNITLFHALIDARSWCNSLILLGLAALASWPERRAWAPLFSSGR
jgi:putative oxidoreductase